MAYPMRKYRVNSASEITGLTLVEGLLSLRFELRERSELGYGANSIRTYLWVLSSV